MYAGWTKLISILHHAFEAAAVQPASTGDQVPEAFANDLANKLQAVDLSAGLDVPALVELGILKVCEGTPAVLHEPCIAAALRRSAVNSDQLQYDMHAQAREGGTAGREQQHTAGTWEEGVASKDKDQHFLGRSDMITDQPEDGQACAPRAACRDEAQVSSAASESLPSTNPLSQPHASQEPGLPDYGTYPASSAAAFENLPASAAAQNAAGRGSTDPQEVPELLTDWFARMQVELSPDFISSRFYCLRKLLKQVRPIRWLAVTLAVYYSNAHSINARIHVIHWSLIHAAL